MYYHIILVTNQWDVAIDMYFPSQARSKVVLNQKHGVKSARLKGVRFLGRLVGCRGLELEIARIYQSAGVLSDSRK